MSVGVDGRSPDQGATSSSAQAPGKVDANASTSVAMRPAGSPACRPPISANPATRTLAPSGANTVLRATSVMLRVGARLPFRTAAVIE